MFESFIESATPWFAEWGLWIVFAATFLESSLLVASVLPGESVLLLAGFLSAPGAVQGQEPPLVLGAVIAVAFLGALLGDMVGYLVGRVGGEAIVRRFGRFFFLPERKIPLLRRYFGAYGKRAIFFGRFAPFIRSIRTLMAGTARMPVAGFVIADAAGAMVWAAGITLVGFLLGESWVLARNVLGAGGGVVLILLVGVFFVSWRGMRRRMERELNAPDPLEPPPGREG